MLQALAEYNGSTKEESQEWTAQEGIAPFAVCAVVFTSVIKHVSKSSVPSHVVGLLSSRPCNFLAAKSTWHASISPLPSSADEDIFIQYKNFRQRSSRNFNLQRRSSFTLHISFLLSIPSHTIALNQCFKSSLPTSPTPLNSSKRLPRTRVRLSNQASGTRKMACRSAYGDDTLVPPFPVLVCLDEVAFTQLRSLIGPVLSLLIYLQVNKRFQSITRTIPPQ